MTSFRETCECCDETNTFDREIAMRYCREHGMDAIWHPLGITVLVQCSINGERVADESFTVTNYTELAEALGY